VNLVALEIVYEGFQSAQRRYPDVFCNMFPPMADAAPDWWSPMDVNEFRGKRITLCVNQVPEGSTGLKSIEQAEREGALSPGKTILEPTSGNTGIALAMIAAVKGYALMIVMSEAVSIERRKMIQAFGAEVTLTDAKLGTDGAILKARQMVREFPDKYFMPDQFSNHYNRLAHYETTAQEILAQTAGLLNEHGAAWVQIDEPKFRFSIHQSHLPNLRQRLGAWVIAEGLDLEGLGQEAALGWFETLHPPEEMLGPYGFPVVTV